MAGLVFYGLYLGGGAIYERVVTSTTVPDLLGSGRGRPPSAWLPGPICSWRLSR